MACGCGKGGGGTSGTSAGSSGGTSTPPVDTSHAAAPVDTAGGAMAATSPYDSGPRAGEQPINGSLVRKGETLFQAKGCTVCHGFGRKITCPDLDGVTMRRTALWMEHQILHPDEMVKVDPITKQLRPLYPLAMTNQGLKPEEARAVIEFLKNKNHQTAAGGK